MNPSNPNQKRIEFTIGIPTDSGFTFQGRFPNSLGPRFNQGIAVHGAHGTF
jgi:hypothetical protein